MTPEEQAEVLKFRQSQSPEIPGCDNLWCVTYQGVPAIQQWQDLLLWERFLNTAGAHYLFEIGSFVGGLSLYFINQCTARNMGFATVDVIEFWDKEHSAIIRNHFIDYFWHMDIWTDEFYGKFSEVVNNPANHPLILFCDGGNKPKEMQAFAPRLSPGDYIVCHDWGNEIAEADLEGVRRLIEPVMKAECEALKSYTRFFHRVEIDLP